MPLFEFVEPPPPPEKGSQTLPPLELEEEEEEEEEEELEELELPPPPREGGDGGRLPQSWAAVSAATIPALSGVPLVVGPLQANAANEADIKKPILRGTNPLT